MDKKDKHIETLEKEITRLKKALILFENKMKQMHRRQVHSDERSRHVKMDVEQIKATLKRRT